MIARVLPTTAALLRGRTKRRFRPIAVRFSLSNPSVIRIKLESCRHFRPDPLARDRQTRSKTPPPPSLRPIRLRGAGCLPVPVAVTFL